MKNQKNPSSQFLKSVLKSAASARVAFPAWFRRFGAVGAFRRLLYSAMLVARASINYRHGAALANRRLAVCRECPLHHNGHCGKPGEFVEGTNEQLGCWCVTDLASRLPEKKCWLTLQGIPFDVWPPE